MADDEDCDNDDDDGGQVELAVTAPPRVMTGKPNPRQYVYIDGPHHSSFFKYLIGIPCVRVHARLDKLAFSSTL